MTITGNDERDRMIFAAMQAATNADESLSLDNIAARLPKDFDLLPAELVAARHAAQSVEPHRGVPQSVETRPQAEPQRSVSTDTDPEPEASQSVEEVPEARLTQAQARVAVESAAKRLDLARLNVRMARSALDVQRGKLADALTAWQNGGPKWTPEMERRHMQEFYAANKRPGPRMSTAKHPAQDMRSGVSGYKGNRRNGLPSVFQHQNVKQAGMFQGGIAKKV